MAGGCGKTKKHRHALLEAANFIGVVTSPIYRSAWKSGILGSRRLKPRRPYHAKSVTDYKEFEGRSHYSVIGGEGWEEVADYALEWAIEHAAKQPAS